MKFFLLLILLTLFQNCNITPPEEIPGCTNPSACNYNTEANEDDGSCFNEIDCLGICGGGAYIDPCGYCDADLENDCLLECTEILSALSIEDVEYQCDGVYTEEGYYCSDLEVLRDFISINPESIHIGMDANNNKIITSLEYGDQIWSSNGRLLSLDLNYNENVVMPTFCNFKLDSLPENIGDLDSLRILILKNNEITTLPESIGDLDNLEKLILESNRLKSFPESIGNLKNLEILYAHHNGITSLPDSFTEIENLEILWLHFNNLESLPENIGSLSNLETLWLNNNQLTSIPASIGQLQALKKLRLDYNLLYTLPDEICNLGIDNNGGLTINLTITNNLTCPIYPACVDKILGYQDCENCASGYLIGDGSAGEDGDKSECLNFGDWQALQDIINANVVYSGMLPIEIVHYSHWVRSGEDNRLHTLILDSEALNGIIPNSIGNLDSLKMLRLNRNNLMGTIPHSIGYLTILQEMKLNSNNLGCYEYDSVNDICTTFCDDSNGCSGKLPDNLTTLAELEILDLKDNYFTQIPEGINNLKKLKKLKLKNNLFQGVLPLEIFDITTLTWLDVSRNQFTGTIPDNINELQDMTNLYFSHNQLSGTIPESICELINLNQVYFNNNQFCPPYPDCIITQVGYQDTSLCTE